MVRPRMMAIAVLVVLSGCFDENSFALTPLGPSASVYSDGATIRVLGCANPTLFRCDPSTDDSMTVMADAEWLSTTSDYPIGEPLVDEVLSPLSAGTVAITTDAPASGVVVVALATSRIKVELRTPPAVDVPATASRSELVTLAYEPMADATLSAVIVETVCDGGPVSTEHLEVRQPGRVELDLSATTRSGGECQHEIHVDQLATVDRADLITISKLSLTSTP